jgi:hypothetical protein
MSNSAGLRLQEPGASMKIFCKKTHEIWMNPKNYGGSNVGNVTCRIILIKKTDCHIHVLIICETYVPLYICQRFIPMISGNYQFICADRI